MNLLFHFRTQGTGAEGVHLAGMANAFTRLGHSVVFSSPTHVDPRTTAGADPFGARQRRTLLARLATRAPAVFFELLELAYNFVCYLRLRSLLARESCDLIYERHAFFLCATALLAQRRRIPLIVEVNELAGDERVRATPLLAPLARLADRLTFQRAQLIVVVSPHLRRRIAALGIDAGKILVLPNAVDEETLEAVTDGAALRARYDCRDALIIGFVGWFVAWHRLDILLAQFAELAQASPRLRLLLVGDGPLAGKLAEQSTLLGIRKQIIFTGPMPHKEIPACIAAMDICVVPHSNEYRSPIKLFEYLAQARAVVAPRTEPITAIVRHGENGLLFDPTDPSDLRAQLSQMATDPALRLRLGKQARTDVASRHTWTQNAKTVLHRLDAPETAL